MTYFTDIKTKEDLKKTFRKLSTIYHPDKGGTLEVMQKINNEYSLLKNTFGVVPEKVYEAKIGNFIYVNSSVCIVTGVGSKLIKAKSLKTTREGYFDKQTGYALFNLKYKAHV